MTVQKIITADAETLAGSTSSVLRTKFRLVTAFDSQLETIISDLRETLHSDTLSVGLAAPQIGYHEAVAIVNVAKKEGEDLVLINPKITSETGSWDKKFESCMSVPHKRGEVKRRKKITLDFDDIDGKPQTLVAEGFLARVIMHEVDHLNGVLFVDRMSEDSALEDTDIFREHGVS